MRNLFSNLIYFYQRKIAPGFKIPKHWLVLDVGSGNMPFWRGDVFLDDLKFGNIQRHLGGGTVKDIGIFVNSDASKMPFKNNAFDFSFCSHLLEHVENPTAVINEIVRVSKQGYIEVPNGILETIAPFHSHLWFIYYADKTLYFVRKSKEMHKILLKNGQNFRELLSLPKDPFIRIYWTKELKYKILDNKNEVKSYTPKTNFKLHKNDDNPGKAYILIVQLVRKFFYKNKPMEQSRIFKSNHLHV